MIVCFQLFVNSLGKALLHFCMNKEKGNKDKDMFLFYFTSQLNWNNSYSAYKEYSPPWKF